MEIDGRIYPIVQAKFDYVLVQGPTGIIGLKRINGIWQVMGSTKAHIVRSFSLPQELIEMIVLEMSPQDVLAYCLINQDAYRLCQEPSFWRRKYLHDYGPPKYLPDKEWRELYIHHGEVQLFHGANTWWLPVRVKMMAFKWAIGLDGRLIRWYHDQTIKTDDFVGRVQFIHASKTEAVLIDQEGALWYRSDKWIKLPYQGKKAYVRLRQSAGILLIEPDDRLVEIYNERRIDLGITAISVSVSNSRVDVAVLDVDGQVWIPNSPGGVQFLKTRLPLSKYIYLQSNAIHSVGLDNQLVTLKLTEVRFDHVVCLEVIDLIDRYIYLSPNLIPRISSIGGTPIQLPPHAQALGGFDLFGWLIR